MGPVAGKPPGPKNPILVGHLLAFRRDPLGFLDRVVRDYGDTVYFRLVNRDLFLFGHPDQIQEVLINQQRNFRKSRVLQRSKVLLGEGLLTSEGDFHLRQRRLVQPAFHRDRLQAYAAAMVELAERAQARWAPGEVREMHDDMMRLTLAIVARTLFRADVETEATAIGRAMTDVLGLFEIALLPFSELLIRAPLPVTRRFEKAKAQLDSTIYRIIEERRRSGEDTGDLLSMLIASRDEKDGALDDRQVRDEALTLFVAGHETTAVALVWSWYLLSRNPRAEAEFHRELDTVLEGRAPTFEDVPRLRYTTAVLSESMRLFPPAWAIGRQAACDVTIGDFAVPKGSIVLVSPWVTHRNPAFWERPEEFQPERFLDDSESRRPKLAYVPFGAGSRICIGERFAWTEGTLVLATIGRRWRLRLTSEEAIPPKPQITLRPAVGVPMTVERR